MLRIFLTVMALLVSPMASAETRVPTSQVEMQLSFAPLVKAAAPAVVNIYVRRVVEQRRSPFGNDPFFRDLFRNFGQSQPRVQNSLGSGVIVSPDGIVVSNYHVVDMATDIRVVLSDRRALPARVLLADQDADLAILKLDGVTDMPHLSIRDSDTVEVGELALAIGNPFGIGQTVSSGIVSGLARSGTATGNARGYFIQTDAPINPGNSGGALIDMAGQLIGINTSILSRSGGSNGIGFAIPASLVVRFVEQAQAGHSAFQRPWAGIVGQPMDQAMADSLGFAGPIGVIIAEMHPQSPLAEHLRVGDIVASVNGQPVNTPAEMMYRMSLGQLGGTAQMTVLRDDQDLKFDIALRTAPQADASQQLVTSRKTAIPGVSVATVTPSIIVDMQLPLSAEGIVVTDPGPVGQRAGLRPGDILLSINSRPITTVEDVEIAFAAVKSQLNMQIQRGTQRLTLRLRL